MQEELKPGDVVRITEKRKFGPFTFKRIVTRIVVSEANKELLENVLQTYFVKTS